MDRLMPEVEYEIDNPKKAEAALLVRILEDMHSSILFHYAYMRKHLKLTRKEKPIHH